LTASSLLLGVLRVPRLALILLRRNRSRTVGQCDRPDVRRRAALLTIVAYTVGNPWPALNPWRRIVRGGAANGYESYPSAFGSGPLSWRC